MKLTHEITITPEQILEAKEKAAKEYIAKIKNSDEYRIGNLRNINYTIKEDKIYIMNGLKIIGVI
ncbi:MAG: hypothetical protein RR363_07535 [Rikenellaceae bacterium]